jgi:hypothetical protein
MNLEFTGQRKLQDDKWFQAAGVAWWSSALTPSWEGARSIPNPGTPFPTLGIGCFTPLPGSGWRVLFDSQHGSIGSEKSDTLQKMGAGQPEPDPQKKKKKKISEEPNLQKLK